MPDLPFLALARPNRKGRHLELENAACFRNGNQDLRQRLECGGEAIAPREGYPAFTTAAAPCDFFDGSAQEPDQDEWGPVRARTPDRVCPRRAQPNSGVPKKSGAARSGRDDKHTRIKPPKDTVKLEDRLFYLLQPPLETWLNTESLSFAFPPFDYQFEGVAFLFPRYSAVLADEMGLGKTMQAITTMRLLLRSGELSSVLLVCPKPLVTNWQREFNLWAPEIPTVVIEGNQARRQWQWENEIAPVRIANYEVVVRDREIVNDPNQKFGLVVLDEAQRIKNRSSTTSQVVRSIPRARGWALTGTPVENSSEDLVGIFEFLSPGFLQPTMTPRRMGQLASDHILRRTKTEVLTDLPPKLYRDAEVALTSEQQRAYDLAEKDGVIKLESMGDRDHHPTRLRIGFTTKTDLQF